MSVTVAEFAESFLVDQIRVPYSHSSRCTRRRLEDLWLSSSLAKILDLPDAVWINQPAADTSQQTETEAA